MIPTMTDRDPALQIPMPPSRTDGLNQTKPDTGQGPCPRLFKKG